MMVGTSSLQSYLYIFGILIFIILSVIPFIIYRANENDSYLLTDRYSRWLLASIIATGCLMFGFCCDSLLLKFRGKINNEWQSNSVLIICFVFSDILMLFSAHQKFPGIGNLHLSLNLLKLVGVAASIIITPILIRFPEDYLFFMRNFSMLALVLVVIGGLLKVTSLLVKEESMEVFKLVSFGFELSAVSIFSGTIFTLFNPLWFVINDSSFTSIELQTDFYRLSVLILYLLINTALHFSMSGDGFLVTPILQIGLMYFLNFLSSYQKRKIIEEMDLKFQERIEMTRYISHEMRTPLNSAAIGLDMGLGIANEMKNAYIYILEDMMKREITKKDIILLKKYILLAADEEITIKQVQDSCTVAVATLDDILTFDKLTEGKLTAEYQDLNPWQFLTHTSKPFWFNASEKEVTLKIFREEEQIHEILNTFIKGDYFKLGQVVRNLLSNALKFTPVKGEIEVKLDFLPASVMEQSDLEKGVKVKIPDYENVVRFSVKDSGAGISLENQTKLFSQYVQINAGELQGGKGSGLGLWISKKIVEMHGGQISVFSAGEGFGSTFYFDLPAYRVADSQTRRKLCLRTSFLMKDTVKSDSLDSSSIPENKPKRKVSINFRNKISPMIQSLSGSFHRANTTIPELVPDLSKAREELFVSNSDSLSVRLSEPVGKTISDNTAFPTILHYSKPTLNTWDNGLNFLLVDDAVSNRKVLKRALERQGHCVEVAEDGVECLEFFEKLLKCENNDIKTGNEDKNEVNDFNFSSLDVILMDDSMPRMTGVEATGRLREMGFKGFLYGVTGDVDPEKHKEFMERGANGVFSKPLNIMELKNALDKQ